MTLADIPKPLQLVGAALLAFLLLEKLGFFRHLGAAAVGAAGDLAGGVVEGIGEQFGIPATSMSECERAKAEGRTWDASFACPAGDFLSYVFNDDSVRSRTRSPPE